MVKPISWLDSGGRVGMKVYQQKEECTPVRFTVCECTAGSELPVTDQPGQGSACLWFNNYTFIPGKPTLDPSMSSLPQKFEEFSLKKHPWTSPGSAPLYSPCGAAGANPNGCLGESSQEFGDFCDYGLPAAEEFGDFCHGWSYGPLAEDYYVSPGFPDVVTTEWKAGDVVEAAWGITGNHGGGYAYRLCKVPEEGMGALTEECFQQGHLEFFGNIQALQVGENVSSRVAFEAHRTKEGTFPKGSQWTRNPVPLCLYTDEPGPDGDYGRSDPKCKSGTQFPAPAPGIFGIGLELIYNQFHPTFNFSIVDQLKVPSNLTPGDYVLSFRSDAEQTSQVYNTCANIKIVP